MNLKKKVNVVITGERGLGMSYSTQEINDRHDWRAFKSVKEVQGYLARKDWYKTLYAKLLKDIEDARGVVPEENG